MVRLLTRHSWLKTGLSPTAVNMTPAAAGQDSINKAMLSLTKTRRAGVRNFGKKISVGFR